jgi:hypothetical protein
MANPIKGEVALSAFGQDYTFVLDLNSLCEAEEYVPGIMDGFTEVKSIRAIRAVFWAGLNRNHPEVTLQEAGRIAQEVGMVKVGQLVGEGVKLAFGVKAVGPAKEGGDSPPAPASPGTGTAS